MTTNSTLYIKNNPNKIFYSARKLELCYSENNIIYGELKNKFIFLFSIPNYVNIKLEQIQIEMNHILFMLDSNFSVINDFNKNTALFKKNILISGRGYISFYNDYIKYNDNHICGVISKSIGENKIYNRLSILQGILDEKRK